jgi:hypothetical protein
MIATNLDKLDTLFEQMAQKYNLYRVSGDVLDKDILTDSIKKYYNEVLNSDINVPKVTIQSPKEEPKAIEVKEDITQPLAIETHQIVSYEAPIVEIKEVENIVPEPEVIKEPIAEVEIIALTPVVEVPVIQPEIEFLKPVPFIPEPDNTIIPPPSEVEISFAEPLPIINTPTVSERIGSLSHSNTLKSMIDINTKIGLINQFFGGNIEMYNQSIEAMSSFTSERSAVEYLNELSLKHNVDKNSDYYTMFITLIQKSFR